MSTTKTEVIARFHENCMHLQYIKYKVYCLVERVLKYRITTEQMRLNQWAKEKVEQLLLCLASPIQKK